MGRGGVRLGAGRPAGTGKFGEQTINVRVPVSLVGAVTGILATHTIDLPRGGSAQLPLVALPRNQEVLITEPTDACGILATLRQQRVLARVVMLDPWYRTKTAVGRSNFVAEAVHLLAAAADVGEHVFLWGFPEHLGRVMDLWPRSLQFRGWLTWYFKNAPTRGKGWRPAQQACLHLSRPGAALYPEHFYSEKHREMAALERLEYKPSPRSVIEAGLISGFIKKSEKTGYPAQKPVSVIEPLLRMTMKPGDLVVDPTCGSGTTGAAHWRSADGPYCRIDRRKRSRLVGDGFRRELYIQTARPLRYKRWSQSAPEEFTRVCKLQTHRDLRRFRRAQTVNRARSTQV